MPTPIQQYRPKHARSLVNLDEAEMTLELLELDMTAVTAPPATMISYDWLSELNSSASMILDREEREAMAKEIEMATKSHPVAA